MFGLFFLDFQVNAAERVVASELEILFRQRNSVNTIIISIEPYRCASVAHS